MIKSKKQQTINILNSMVELFNDNQQKTNKKPLLNPIMTALYTTKQAKFVYLQKNKDSEEYDFIKMI